MCVYIYIYIYIYQATGIRRGRPGCAAEGLCTALLRRNPQTKREDEKARGDSAGETGRGCLPLDQQLDRLDIATFTRLHHLAHVDVAPLVIT